MPRPNAATIDDNSDNSSIQAAIDEIHIVIVVTAATAIKEDKIQAAISGGATAAEEDDIQAAIVEQR